MFQKFQRELNLLKAKKESEERKKLYEENLRLGLAKKKGRKCKDENRKEERRSKKNKKDTLEMINERDTARTLIIPNSQSISVNPFLSHLSRKQLKLSVSYFHFFACYSFTLDF